MKLKYRCPLGHVFENHITSARPANVCPVCNEVGVPTAYVGDDDPPTKEDDDSPTTSVLDDMAVIDSILAESSTAEATEASVPDAGGFSGFDGGDSGGAGASDSFDGGSADTASV